MGVHCKAGNIKGIAQHHIGGFSAHAGQRGELFQSFRNLSAELFHQELRGADEVFGLYLITATGMYDLRKLLWVCLRHTLGIRIFGK